MKRAVIFSAVSHTKKGQGEQDPRTQTLALRGAAERMGWTVARVVEEKGSRWEPEEAERVRRETLAVIERGEATVLMVWAWDRWSREGPEAAFRLLSHLEKHLGAEFYSLQEPFLSTATSDPALRPLIISLISWAANYESSRKSERIRARAASKRHRAGTLGEKARWGGGRLASADEIVSVKALRAGGQSLRDIARTTGLSKSQVDRILKAGA